MQQYKDVIFLLLSAKYGPQEFHHFPTDDCGSIQIIAIMDETPTSQHYFPIFVEIKNGATPATCEHSPLCLSSEYY